jgi:hypothetical protein
MSSQLSPICQKIENEIKGLDQERDSLQEELQHAAPGEKAFLVSQIKALNTQITKKNKELADCIKQNPFMPPPKPKPNPCKPIAQEIIKLENALNTEVHNAVADLQEELQHAAPGEKPGLVAQIKKISADIRKNSKTAKQIAAKQKEYADCLQTNGGLLALSATFKGTATMLTSNSNAPGPFKQGVTIGLAFSDWDHRDIWVSSFPPISVTYDVGFPVGQVTTTVSLSSGVGTFDPPSNTITLKLSLFFHHSTSLAGDSTLDITLSTTSLLTAAGKITVSGSSKFKGGYLGGDTCWLTVEGTISPHP